METLGTVLSCPVCMELFTPPVLLLPCSHNFCKRCLELVLVCQNCAHASGQFCCPVCRQVTYLKGRGMNGFQRNILAENILEKFKEELEKLSTKEQNQLAQMCEKHGEIMNLMCLCDEEPICGMCKLFGDHVSHHVAKLCDAYAERKVSFAADAQLMLQKSECTAQALQETERLIRELTGSADRVRALVDAVGDSLLRDIRSRMAALRQQLERELSCKLERLQLAARELQAPGQLCQRMTALLQHHRNALQFLREHRKLRAEMKTFTDSGLCPQVPRRDSISLQSYFQELLKGIDISAFEHLDRNKVLGAIAGLQEAWQAGWTQSPTSQQAFEDALCKAVLGWAPKPNTEAEFPGTLSHPSASRSWAQGRKVGSRESRV